MKNETPGQESLKNTRIIQKSIAEHLDDLETWGPMYKLEVNYPELFADDATHTACFTWGCNKSIKDAMALTEKFQAEFQYPRLTVEFIGSVLIADE